MRMMQTKRRYHTDDSSNRMVMPSNVTTFLRPSTAVRTNKSNGDSKPSLFKTPPLRTTTQVSSPTKTARVEMLKNKFSNTISKAEQALQSKHKISRKVTVPKKLPEQKRVAPNVVVPNIWSTKQKRAARKAFSTIEQKQASPKEYSVREQRRASREALDAVKPTYNFNENLDVMKEFENLLTNGIECNPNHLINNTSG